MGWTVNGSSAHIESGSSAHIANESSAHRETGSSAHIERSSAHIDAGYQPFRVWLGGCGGDKSVHVPLHTKALHLDRLSSEALHLEHSLGRARGEGTVKSDELSEVE